MPILLSDDELEALEGLPHLHRCLYIFGIRRYMDYQTGTTGIKRKISYKSLSEETYVEPHQGLKNTGANSKEQIRRVVKSLEKAGLITIKSSDKNLILECILAKRDKSVQNKPDTNPTPQPDPQADPLGATPENKENPYKDSDFNRSANAAGNTKPDPQADIPKNAKADTHPVSVNTTVLHSTSAPENFEDSEETKAFFSLFKRYGYFCPQLEDNANTRIMIMAWIKAGVTPELAETKIKPEIKKRTKPPHPTYFRDAVLELKKYSDVTNQKAEDIQHAERTAKPTPAGHQGHRQKSKSAEFWEDAESNFFDGKRN